MSIKHTPEPWAWDTIHTSEITIYSKEPTIYGDRFVACIPWAKTNRLEQSKANGQRIVECVNAMEGIENPIEFMKRAKQTPSSKLIGGINKYTIVEDNPASLKDELINELKVEVLTMNQQITERFVALRSLGISSTKAD